MQTGCGGWRIKKILRSRLPERFSGTLPPLLVEIAVGVAVAVLFTALRVILVPWTGDRAPYALSFLAVVGATVLGGWRSGLVTVAVGQALIWFLILDPGWTFAVLGEAQQASLAMATGSELLILVILALYQREVDRAWSKREDQMDLLQKALLEIDHRTSNNYQTVLALILAQAKSAKDAAAKEALEQVAGRIRAIANASRKLALASESLQGVRVADHLQDLCVEIERGLSRPSVSIKCQFEDIVVDAEETVCVSILVNELVTNALKHAFPDGRGGVVRVALTRSSGGLELSVEDDGIGLADATGSRGTGLGTRLVATYIKQLRAKHKVTSSSKGTRHFILIPA